jgi:hypothetical protein
MPTVVIASHRYSATGAWGPRDYKLKAKYHKWISFGSLILPTSRELLVLEAEVHPKCK